MNEDDIRRIVNEELDKRMSKQGVPRGRQRTSAIQNSTGLTISIPYEEQAKFRYPSDLVDETFCRDTMIALLSLLGGDGWYHLFPLKQILQPDINKLDVQFNVNELLALLVNFGMMEMDRLGQVLYRTSYKMIKGERKVRVHLPLLERYQTMVTANATLAYDRTKTVTEARLDHKESDEMYADSIAGSDFYWHAQFLTLEDFHLIAAKRRP